MKINKLISRMKFLNMLTSSTSYFFAALRKLNLNIATLASFDDHLDGNLINSLASAALDKLGPLRKL